MGVEGEEGTMPPTYDAATGLTESADQKVNIAPSDTKIEMGKEKEKEEEGFKGLSKEELMQFANDPFWMRLRWTLFVLFWIVWVAMLVASVVIIIYAPKCPSPEAKQWWQKGPVYKSPVETFPDGNGDNERDLKDVEENVDYLVGLGVGSVYLTSVLSPNNLEQVKQEYGTMEDWKSLSNSLQERGLRMIVDFVPTSTSENHMWFEEAQANNEEFASYYKSGAQLDLDNAKVQDELTKIVEFWATNGVDGFVVKEADGIPSSLLEKFRRALETVEAESGVEKVLMVDDLSEPMLKMLMPGTVVCEAGEELGLTLDQAVTANREDLASQQHRDLFSLLTAKLRPQDAILFGNLRPEDSFVKGQDVFGMVRVKKGSPGYLFLINLGDNLVESDLSDVKYLPEVIRVFDGGAVSAVAPYVAPSEGEVALKRFPSNAVPLEPGQAKIFNFVPKF